MSERLRHPILSAKLAWTDRRIAATEKTQSQATRIISLPQAPHNVKEEAIVNRRRSGERLFDLHERKRKLEDRLSTKEPVMRLVTVTLPERLFTGAKTGDDVFRGYDLGSAKTKSAETVGFPKGKLESYNREIPNIVTHLKRLATIVNSPNASLIQRDLTQKKMDRMNIRLQLLSSKREALINKNR